MKYICKLLVDLLGILNLYLYKYENCIKDINTYIDSITAAVIKETVNINRSHIPI